MPQAIGETIFDVLYLGFAITAGLIMLIKGNQPLVKKFGLMSVLLGAGDSFHLVPRSYALWTTGLEANAAALGIGRLITSITMTVFYLILFYIWRERYKVRECNGLTKAMWLLTILRIALCALPQNQWPMCGSSSWAGSFTKSRSFLFQTYKSKPQLIYKIQRSRHKC